MNAGPKIEPSETGIGGSTHTEMSQILSLSWGAHLEILGGSCCYACYLGGGCPKCRLKARNKLVAENRERCYFCKGWHSSSDCSTLEPEIPLKKKSKKKQKFYRGGQFLPGGDRAPIGGCTIP